jgi:hypothetical protein
MKLAKISIIITAAVYLIIGVMFLTSPVYWVKGVDILLPTPTAIIDLQATYGGCMFALGIFFLYTYKNLSLIRMGLILQAITLGGFAFGRFVGILMHGIPKPIIFYLFIAEISGVILAIYCLSQMSKTDKI